MIRVLYLPVFWLGCIACFGIHCSTYQVTGGGSEGEARVATISGTLLGENSGVPAGREVVLRSVVITAGGDSILSRQSVLCRDDGSYTFRGVPFGKYTVQCTDSAGLTAFESRLAVTDTVHTVKPITMNVPVVLKGRIVDVEEPGGIAVWIPGSGVRGSVDSNGSYTLSGAPAGFFDICFMQGDVVNYLSIMVGDRGSSSDTIFLRDIPFARSQSGAYTVYSFFDYTLLYSFLVLPIRYAIEELPPWYEGRDLESAHYFRVDDSEFVEVFDTLIYHDTVTVTVRVTFHDTVTIYDTLIWYDTVDLGPIGLKKARAGTLSAETVSRTATHLIDTLVLYDTVYVYDTIVVYDTVPVYADTLLVDSLGRDVILIDAFEDGDKFSTLFQLMPYSKWVHWSDNVRGGTTVSLPSGVESDIALAIGDQAGLRGKGLGVTFHLGAALSNPFSNPYASVGILLHRTPEERFANLSKMQAFSFVIRGRGRIAVQFYSKKVSSYPAADQWGQLGYIMDCPAQWQRITITPDMIVPPPNSRQLADKLTWAAVADSIDNIGFGSWMAAGDTVEIMLDDIYLIGLQPPALLEW